MKFQGFRGGAPLMAVAAFVLIAAGVRAQAPSSGPGPGPGEGLAPHGRPEGMTRELGLSEAQEDRVREILNDRRAQRDTLREKISANRDALHGLLEGGSADATAVGELVLEGRKLQEQSRALRESEQKAIRAILTPEQQKKFDEVKERRGAGRGPGGHPGTVGREGFPGPPPGQPGSPPPGQPGSPRQRPPFGASGQPPLPW